MLCQYKHIFGKPGEGIHQYRVLGIAAVDLILTIAAAYLISLWKPHSLSFLYVFAALFAIGTILHCVFCVSTPVSRLFCAF